MVVLCQLSLHEIKKEKNPPWRGHTANARSLILILNLDRGHIDGLFQGGLFCSRLIDCGLSLFPFTLLLFLADEILIQRSFLGGGRKGTEVNEHSIEGFRSEILLVRSRDIKPA